jgi:hypothetical protein
LSLGNNDNLHKIFKYIKTLQSPIAKDIKSLYQGANFKNFYRGRAEKILGLDLKKKNGLLLEHAFIK